MRLRVPPHRYTVLRRSGAKKTARGGGGAKPSKWAPYMGVRLYYADLDIRSIETRHGVNYQFFSNEY